MITFPNAKINLGLSIIEKRSDGFHNLESCFHPIGWSDILEIIPSEELNFTSSGITIPGSEQSNLCLKAYHILNAKHNISPVKIHLHKLIPIGAGLGGGSSDGAFALKMLNNIFQLSLSIEQLESYAAELGSDCPFFIQNQPKYVTETGNVFREIENNIVGKHLVVVNPHIHISTAEAYEGIQPQKPAHNTLDIIENNPIADWPKLLSNDFEQSIFPNHPQILSIKERLYQNGALYASMTGSGASVFGVFDKKIDFKPKDEMIWEGYL